MPITPINRIICIIVIVVVVIGSDGSPVKPERGGLHTPETLPAAPPELEIRGVGRLN